MPAEMGVEMTDRDEQVKDVRDFERSLLRLSEQASRLAKDCYEWGCVSDDAPLVPKHAGRLARKAWKRLAKAARAAECAGLLAGKAVEVDRDKR